MEYISIACSILIRLNASCWYKISSVRLTFRRDLLSRDLGTKVIDPNKKSQDIACESGDIVISLQRQLIHLMH